MIPEPQISLRMNTVSTSFVRTYTIDRMMSEEHYGAERKSPNIHFWHTYFNREEQVKDSMSEDRKEKYRRENHEKNTSKDLFSKKNSRQSCILNVKSMRKACTLILTLKYVPTGTS